MKKLQQKTQEVIPEVVFWGWRGEGNLLLSARGNNSDSHNHTYHSLVACLYTHDVVEGNPHAVISGGGRGLVVAAFGGVAVQDHQSGERGGAWGGVLKVD